MFAIYSSWYGLASLIILFLCLAIGFGSIVLQVLRHKKFIHYGFSNLMTSFWILIIAIVVGITTAIVLNTVDTEERDKYYTDNIRDFYKAEIMNGQHVTFSSGSDGKASKNTAKILVTFGDDKRIYEVYLIKDIESGTVSLYSKNEKGVYMPITPASSQTAYDGVDSSVKTETGESESSSSASTKEVANEDSEVSM